MKIGTKSVLFGAHCFFLHPFYVAAAWDKLYGFPWDPRLWFAFFLHDIGYLGKPNMDGPEGERHPELGATVMGVLFDMLPKLCKDWETLLLKWHDFSLYHSRTYAKLHGVEVSKLCYADKLAFSYQIKWIYLLGVKATGEITEYMDNARRYNEEHGRIEIRVDTPANWYDDMVEYMRQVAISGAN